ncbi:MAG: hypothetical protein KKE64_08195 [Candidatus Omnitrophica bacterium]|nr:hypothetical protein [Candidatus Omnitrophota bacterium]
MATITEIIQNLLDRGYTYADLGSIVGKTETTIRRWHQGSVPNKLFIKKLEKLMNKRRMI